MAMAERMKELGGRLEITSGSWGTSVRATVPRVLSKLESEGESESLGTCQSCLRDGK
jgi:signal transduction histidine kinase